MTLDEFYELHGSKITQDSERLFINDFLFPLLGANIQYIVPQYPFLDRSGKLRRMDFAYHGLQNKLALEVNGETYHAEGIIPGAMFDDNLFRQNEILRLGYSLLRFSYSQLQSPQWRDQVQGSIRDLFAVAAPELLSLYSLKPTPLQEEALQALSFFRDVKGRTKGVVVLPTGTGKTVLSAIDARRHGGRTLFLVHRLDILKQSIDAYKMVWPDMRLGVLTGEVKEHELDCDVLFASKDTLRQPDQLERFPRDWFSYIVVDEVHHGQSPSYRDVLTYFQPQFMLGMTATPDRTDRKDIFELFEYSKIYEIPLSDVIDQGYLVPYTYHGLTDDIDYSKVRFQGLHYNVADLERLLIVPERNEAIVREYLEKGSGDKAIGFCVSIKHAERMAEFFNEHGITAVAIHSEAPNRDELVQAFRENKFQVAFTVDLFNEGIDFPNVQVLLFLRPTESKTVFLQQLGRGLRLCIGKDRVRILDFIGNYRRANQIRKFLAKSSTVTESDENGRTKRKTLYEYSTGCEVHFDESVQEILDRQDAEELGITKDDLKEAYFTLAERLSRKPSRSDLDRDGEYKSGKYVQLFGSWVGFLREVGEYTEASYHYPQGTHLGHILAILYFFGTPGIRAGSPFDDEYIRLRGGLGDGRLSGYRRQIKYKLQAAMELGIITDDREYPEGQQYTLELKPLGRELYRGLQPLFSTMQLDFPRGEDGIPSSRMENEASINREIRDYIGSNPAARTVVYRVFLQMHAVQQMLAFIYHIAQKATISRREIYEQFFQSPFVKQYCDQEGIEETTVTAAEHRCPFLLNILDACDIIQAERTDVIVKKLILFSALVKPFQSEEPERAVARLEALRSAWPDKPEVLTSEDLSILRELFGPAFLTADYHLSTAVIES
ncbi:DEAD/DEAH box helicase [Tunturiibacter gelidoferens]|uniref:Superfamily II DNA or RNA helicase n=1 Tax=Tunturiibacter gelidiferens TaxID=3069689 RepID=A0ACC5P556_9BACT|nr:DEAD/DEAH box helicase [Edaphobacter lichenicola]MBB5341993.1 superfamily II DNA or RNA helicase [Edaphobacter lichenicola]